MDYYCAICERLINQKKHYFMKNYVTNIYKYNDIV